MDAMEITVSSPKTDVQLPTNSADDLEEKEISDDEDDDRNHKHRRRETRSQSMERDSEQVLTRPLKRRNRPFENGHSQSSENWKKYNMPRSEKDASANFENRRAGSASFPRVPNRFNQSFSAELGHGRGRGRESGPWNQYDPRFSSSQMFPQGPGSSSAFAGRGFQNVPNSQNASWSTFGLIPGLPNGGMDTLHSLGLPGAMGPSISPPLNIGIPRQRCRDFEERGFCLRGDMCPMEHGINRIVIEDVQSLSQFNLPVSLPNANMLGPSALSSVNASSLSSTNKSLLGKSYNPEMADDGLGKNGAFTSSSGADFYDPDQPLWTDDRPESSTGLRGISSSKVDETDFLLETDPSDQEHDRAKLFDGNENGRHGKSVANNVGSQTTSSSVWGRVGGVDTKSKLEKEKFDSGLSSSNYTENDMNKDQQPLTDVQAAAFQGKLISAQDTGSQALDPSMRIRGDTGRNNRNVSQKAQRTLFVNGIPLKDNKRETLLSHFKKFGEVIDIYIPFSSERAFVQFSAREEAEAALKAPDAVLGNRFIKLYWANRDNILDDGTRSGSFGPGGPRGVLAVSVPPHVSVAYKGKDNVQAGAPKNTSTSASSAGSLPDPKLVVNSPKAPPPLQKKLENLELLKEELRKKQELLDQKRNAFRRQLDKIQKQATGLKDEVISEQPAKRQKPGAVAEVAKAVTPCSTDSTPKAKDNVVHPVSKPTALVTQQEPSNLKHFVRPLAPAGATFVTNRFKLDNRPTTFRIIPPLPKGLADVAVLKEHFSAYGELSSVELEDVESSDSGASPKSSSSARICFPTRHAAERAFANGKSWQGHEMHFSWVASSSSNSKNDNGVRENAPSNSSAASDISLSPAKPKVSTRDVSLQSGGVVGIDSQEEAASLSGGGGSQVVDQKAGEQQMGKDEDPHSSLPSASGEK